MTQTTRPHTTANHLLKRSPRPQRRGGHRAHLISEAVVASYIHDISARHQRRDVNVAPSPFSGLSSPHPAIG